MADEKNDLSRRDFVALSLAAGIAAAAGDQLVSAAELPVMAMNVEVKTPDGTCDATFIHPTSGSHPAVIIWPDAFGLRPAMVDMGKRIAAEASVSPAAAARPAASDNATKSRRDRSFFSSDMTFSLGVLGSRF